MENQHPDREKAEWLAARAGLFKGATGWEAWVQECVEVIEAAYRKGYSAGENAMIEAQQEF